MPMRPRKISPHYDLHRGEDHPTQIWLGSEPPQRIIYFPSGMWFDWWLSLAPGDYTAPQHIAGMAHIGQPQRRDIQLLKLLREPADAVVEVFGGLGPNELLLYATLYTELNPSGRGAKRRPVVEYSSVITRVIALAERDLGKKIIEARARPFDEQEAALMDFIRKNSRIDLKELLGARAASILESGRSLTFEGLLVPMMKNPRMAWTITRWLRPPRRF